MSKKYRYKDLHNREVYPKFEMVSYFAKYAYFDNAMLTCTLYVRRNIPSWFPFNKSSIFHKKITRGYSTDKVEILAKYGPEDYNLLVQDILEKYNEKELIKYGVSHMNNLVKK